MRISDWMSDVCSSDLAVTRRWLAEAIFEAVGANVVVVEQASLKTARQWLASLGNEGAYPWLAVIDIGLPDGRGIEIVRDLAVASPRTRAVVATIYGDDAHLMDAIAAGAQGYLLKEEDRERIVFTLRRRLEARRVGKECVRTGGARGWWTL